MVDGHETDGLSLPVDGIDYPKTSDAKLPQAIQFTVQGSPALWIGEDAPNGCTDRALEIGM